MMLNFMAIWDSPNIILITNALPIAFQIVFSICKVPATY